MRVCVPALLAACLAAAQSTTTIYSTDLNGRRVAEASAVSSDSTRTQLSSSVNGRQVPLQQTQERVLRDDPSGKVTETLVRRYNPNGQLASTERIVTEEQKLAGGGSTVRSTSYQTDVNGREQQTERRTTDTRVAGPTTTSQTVIERPTLSGSFETTEKRNSVTNTTDSNKSTTEQVYRRNSNGDFYEAVRRVETDTKSQNQTVSHASQYEPGITGALQLRSQNVSTTTTQPDGTTVTEVNLYAPAADGRVQEPGAAQQIKEQQVITRSKSPDGSVVESVSVRRPSLADPRRLGDLQKISETVCTGKCGQAEPAASKSEPAKPEQAKPEQAKPVQAKSEQAKSEQPRPEPANVEPAKPQPDTRQPATPQPAKPQPAKPAPAKPAPTRI